MIYISYTTEYYKYAKQVKENLLKFHHKVSMWEPNTPYRNADLLNSGIVVFVIKDFKFSSDFNDLTLGLSKELLLAYKEKKTIKIAYVTRDNSLKYYDAHLTLNKKSELLFTGITGSGSTRISDIPCEIEDTLIKIASSDDDFLLI